MSHPVAYVEHRPHPRGKTGALLSTKETAAKARAARMDPEVHAWDIAAIKASGVRSTNPEVLTRVLLDAHRRDKLFVPDPTDGEFLVSPECLLGTCGGIKFNGEDCDGLAAGLAAALLSIGIPAVAIVGQRYRDGGQIEHVIDAMWDRRRWWRADATNESYALGEADDAVSEQWIDVLTGRTICDGKCDQLNVPAPPIPSTTRAKGDFVGVSGSDLAPNCRVNETSFWTPLLIGTGVGTAMGVLAGWLMFRKREYYDVDGSHSSVRQRNRKIVDRASRRRHAEPLRDLGGSGNRT